MNHDESTWVRLPFMQVSVRDWGDEPSRVSLSYADRGRLWDLERAWWLHGYLPVEPAAVARLTGIPEGELGDLLRWFFPVDEDGEWRDCPLWRDKRNSAQLAYENRANAGRESAEKRSSSGPKPKRRKASRKKNGDRTSDRDGGRSQSVSSKQEAVSSSKSNTTLTPSAPSRRAEQRGESVSEDDLQDLLANLRAAYPPRTGDGSPAEEIALRALLETGIDPAVILEGADAYREDCRINDTEERFVKKLVNWLRDRDFEAWQDQEPRKRTESPSEKVHRWIREADARTDDDPFTIRDDVPVVEAEPMPMAPSEDEGPDFEVEPEPTRPDEADQGAPEERAQRRREVLEEHLGRRPGTVPSAEEWARRAEARAAFGLDRQEPAA